jgi:copper ion binding protein
MDELTFRVPGMTCDHCVAAVEAELGRVAGVERVSVDLATKAVVVVGEGVERSTVWAAVDEAGYEPTDEFNGHDEP